VTCFIPDLIVHRGRWGPVGLYSQVIDGIELVGLKKAENSCERSMPDLCIFGAPRESVFTVPLRGNGIFVFGPTF